MEIGMKSSYNVQDVILLLKDITGLVNPQSTDEREKLIQSGRHYCEMLPIEYSPSKQYMEAYKDALNKFSAKTAQAIGVLSDKIIDTKSGSVVLVSLARAGIPAGILIKRYIKLKYNIEVMHYSISIIRGKGIDKNAINYILERHFAKDVLFVDGWIGKGAILNELKKDVQDFKDLSSDLAVISDPANVTRLCGTHEDILIPSSCLNCTVSGLISRTFLRDDVIGPKDFHGAVYYKELQKEDLSYDFINAIESHFILDKCKIKEIKINISSGIDEVNQIAAHFNIKDINFIKPGIGETTRVLLRRVPWKILIDEKYRYDDAVSHIIRLASEKNVQVEYYPLKNYKTCGLIKQLADV